MRVKNGYIDGNGKKFSCGDWCQEYVFPATITIIISHIAYIITTSFCFSVNRIQELTDNILHANFRSPLH